MSNVDNLRLRGRDTTATWTRATSSLKTKANLRKQIDDFFIDLKNQTMFATEEKQWNKFKQNYGQTKVNVILELAINKLQVPSNQRISKSEQSRISRTVEKHTRNAKN